MSVRSREGHREKQVEKKKSDSHINKINPNHFKKKNKQAKPQNKMYGYYKITVKNFLYSEGKDFRDGF